LENVFDSGPELIAQVIDSIADPRVDICLDLGHVNCFTKGDCVAWIKYLNARIGYVHMHDNNGLKDEHLGIGRGTIPFAQVCEALNGHAPDAVWALECEIDHMTDSVDWLRKYGFI
jgi:sugar phosphate isomerase/epimerase